MKTAPHLFLSESGDLFDERKQEWALNPIRKAYSKTFAEINNSHELRATMRAGNVAWPGCYPMYFIANDGESLSFESVRENYHQCAYSMRHGINDGWRIVGCAINWEDPDMLCAHSGKPIECAYSEN